MSLNFFREQLFLTTAWSNSQRNIWLGDFDRALRKWQVLTVKHVIYATRENFHTQKITEFLLIQARNSLNGRILWMHVSLQHLLFESRWWYLNHNIQYMVLQDIKMQLAHCIKFNWFYISKLRGTLQMCKKRCAIDLSQLFYAETGQMFRTWF